MYPNPAHLSIYGSDLFDDPLHDCAHGAWLYRVQPVARLHRLPQHLRHDAALHLDVVVQQHLRDRLEESVDLGNRGEAAGVLNEELLVHHGHQVLRRVQLQVVTGAGQEEQQRRRRWRRFLGRRHSVRAEVLSDVDHMAE